VLVQAPVYPPFLSAPGNQQRELQTAPLSLRYVEQGPCAHLHYDVDFDAFEAEIHDRTRLFILCNPHNPVGRAYAPAELTRMAEICEKHDLVICSDEIHADLLMADTKHVPIASLAEEISQRTITLLAPSKTYNLPGLGCSMAIVQNPELRTTLQSAARGIVPHVNLLGYVAAETAYTQCEEWLNELLTYLTANRDFLVEYVNEHLPGVRTTRPEATYLAWLDCRATGIDGNPHKFFLEHAKVALNDGASFGPGGEGFVRMNYGCPRALLEEGLERMREALAQVENPVAF
jgi:cystathionine beta-lyase